MGRIKQAIMWLEENGYEASDENLKFVPIDTEFKASHDMIKTHKVGDDTTGAWWTRSWSYDADTGNWIVLVRSASMPCRVQFISSDKFVALAESKAYIDYKSKAHD
jgi:hypothetical protein